MIKRFGVVVICLILSSANSFAFCDDELSSSRAQALFFEQLEQEENGLITRDLYNQDAAITQEVAFDAKDKMHKPLFISLGGNCACAYQIKTRGYCEGFFPFDWMFSEPESIIRAFRDDFKDFLKKEQLELSSYNNGEKKYVVKDRIYNMLLNHDFMQGPQGVLWDYDTISKKYQRRIARFRRALASGRHIVLVRTKISRQEAELLVDTIKEKHPNMLFTLVVINDTAGFDKPWNSNNIINYYMPDPYADAVGPAPQRHALWTAVFNNIVRELAHRLKN